MKFWGLLMIVLLSFVEAGAQLCGTYGAALTITDEADKPIENVSIKIVPQQEDDYTINRKFVREEKNSAVYRISFSEGYFVKGRYKIIISAAGYETADALLEFPHCKRQKFEFRLKTGQNRDRSILTGTIYDARGSVVPNAKVSAVSQNGEKFEAASDGEGVYVLNLPFNRYPAANFREARYDITVEMNGFKKTQIDDFVFIPSSTGKMNLDVGLELLSTSSHEPCGYAGGDCPKDIEPVEVKSVKISEKISEEPLEKMPKAENKTKRKNRNNK